jgi:uncharacterized protein
VAIAASLGFIFGIGGEGVRATWVIALLLGGIIAAPIAAWLVRIDWIDAPDAVRYGVYALIYALWAALVP